MKWYTWVKIVCVIFCYACAVYCLAALWHVAGEITGGVR